MATMNYLTVQAAYLYLDICRWSLGVGLIGPDQFVGRVYVLRQVSNPTEEVWRIANLILQADGDGPGDQDGWDDESSFSLTAPEAETARESTRESKGQNGGPDDSYILEMVTTVGTRRWQFHLTDADPWPSVPHGHAVQDGRRKLDAYQGFTYRNGRPEGREGRRAIIDLWNDRNFRKFARAAIRVYSQRNPWWERASWPLPRRRRTR